MSIDPPKTIEPSLGGTVADVCLALRDRIADFKGRSVDHIAKYSRRLAELRGKKPTARVDGESARA